MRKVYKLLLIFEFLRNEKVVLMGAEMVTLKQIEKIITDRGPPIPSILPTIKLFWSTIV